MYIRILYICIYWFEARSLEISLNSARRWVVLQATKRLLPTALIIVNNSTFTLSILAYFFVTNFEPWPRAITNFFACCNRLNERFFVYTVQVAPIKRIKVGTSEYLVIFRCIYVCVCTSFLPIKSTHFIDMANTPEQRQAAVISLRWYPYKYWMLKILNKTVFFHY